MRCLSLSLLIAAAFCITVAAAWIFFIPEMSDHYRQVHRLTNLPSDIRLSLTIRYARGAQASERYFIRDENGISSIVYGVTGRDGVTTRIQSLPAARYDVPALFGALVRDGIWDLPDAPPRGDTSVTYLVTVMQRIDGRQGAHIIRFTDPHYWATNAGRRYHLHLDKDKAVPDFLYLHSESAAEPRYERILTDFRRFGSPELRARIAAAKRTSVR